MMADVSSRDRQALKRGAILAGLMVLWTFGIRPMSASIRELSDRVDEERALLVRELAVLEAAPQYARAVNEGGDHLLELAPRLFGGATSGVAAAHLAEHVQNAARNARVMLTRLDPGEIEPRSGGVEALSAQVSGESDVEGLLTMLYLLEGGEKLVRVADLRVQAGRVAVNSVQETMEVITFEFTVTGFQLAGFDPDAEPEAEPETPAPAEGVS